MGKPFFLPKLIALCRWSDYQEKLLREMDNKPAALAAPIYKQLLKTQTKGNRLNDEQDGIIDVKGRKIMDFNIGLEKVKSALLRSGVPLLSSTTAYYVVTWLLKEVHRQIIMGHKSPRRIVLKGNAYERLGDLSGAGAHPKTVDMIRKIIPALSGCIFKYQTQDRIGEGNFLSYRYERALNGNYSVLMIEMQPLACTGFVKTLPEGGAFFQEQRKVVPITKPFVPYGKQRKSYGSQIRFQNALVALMRDSAKELYTRGGIPLSDEDLCELGQESQLASKLIQPALDFWVSKNYLARSDDGLYSLGPKESAARKMMEEAGRFEIEGTMAAKRGLEKRRRKVAAGGV